MKPTYLDHAAATPIHPQVLEAMRPFLVDHFYNPSSPYLQANLVLERYLEAKATLAKLIGAKADNIVALAGATEALNLVLFSFSKILISPIEHDATFETASRMGAKIVKALPSGIIDLEDLKHQIDDEDQLIVISLVNSELGTIQPVKEIAKLVAKVNLDRLKRQVKIRLQVLVDASAGFNILEVNVGRLGVDYLVLNAGKFYGPKQVAVLYAKDLSSLKPVYFGGGQEDGIRPGTENVAGLIGMAKAASIVSSKRQAEASRLTKISEYILKSLKQHFPTQMQVNTPLKRCLPGFLSLSFLGLDATRLVFRLERHNIMVATGAACVSSGFKERRVLKAIGLDAEAIDGTIRISLGRLTTFEDIQMAMPIIISEIEAEYQRVAKS